jgi:hypothetical protein
MKENEITRCKIRLGYGIFFKTPEPGNLKVIASHTAEVIARNCGYYIEDFIKDNYIEDIRGFDKNQILQIDIAFDGITDENTVVQPKGKKNDK